MSKIKNNARMSSIAWKINFHFWFDKLITYLFFDLIVMGILFGYFIISSENNATGNDGARFFDLLEFYDNPDVTDRTFKIDSDNHEIIYIVEVNGEKTYKYEMIESLGYFVSALKVLVIVQIISLIFALFSTKDVRRKLKPLNEIAVKAESLSNMSLDYSEYNNSKFEQLEHAIENVSPDAADVNISTGDKDLRSIEIAINNLIRHMKETQMQQARFVSDASHELRTPIAVIEGYVNMLDRWGKDDEEVLAESIEALKNESTHMKELVEQLLFLARGDTGRNTLNKVEIDMSELMREVWEESTMIDEKHTYEFVDTTSDSTSRTIIGDVAMIKQSARIFLQNAAKYSNEGATITIKVATDNEKVSYIIQDEGIGMNDNDVNHIFERFFRSDKARTAETGGSGLGLSIAKWIVDSHDGVIDVISRTGFGTRFIVSFPK